MGGVTGGAFGNILEASGLPAEVELAREAIQNSCDASAGQRPVLVRFKILHLTGDEKLRFMEVLQLLDGLGSRARELSLPEPNCLENGSERLQLTFIEDFETVGLSGDPHSPDSHFFRLLLELGDPAKTADVGTGGSYGFGKSALSLPSRLRTIVAYTLFNDAERGAVHRLMGCGYFRPHRHAGSHYTGRAWFAVPCNHDGENGYHPVEGIEAQQLARSLGFVERTSAGTSILVVDSQVDPDLLIEGIEDWWWPRLLDAKLQVEVEVDGASRHPRLRSNPRLAPFIQCYELAIGKSGPVGTHQKCAELNRLAGQDLGRCAFMYLEAHEEQRLAPSWADSRSASVALIREPR
ncbi:MAG TPA: hypothetical protein VNM43_10325, partial [Dehalococcoidia bacterium]|nr:hypothetical protein [Dehalococcoidia bacterium]